MVPETVKISATKLDVLQNIPEEDTVRRLTSNVTTTSAFLFRTDAMDLTIVVTVQMKIWPCVVSSSLSSSFEGFNDLRESRHSISLFSASLPCDPHRRFRCANHKCIPKYQICDQIDNCGDGSDENNMTMCANRIKPCDPINEYMCANKNCISRLQVCDHTDHCGDLSDELGCRKLFLLLIN